MTILFLSIADKMMMDHLVRDMGGGERSTDGVTVKTAARRPSRSALRRFIACIQTDRISA